jgi:hypothetical protein
MAALQAKGPIVPAYAAAVVRKIHCSCILVKASRPYLRLG